MVVAMRGLWDGGGHEEAMGGRGNAMRGIRKGNN